MTTHTTTNFDLLWEAEPDEPPSLDIGPFMAELFRELDLDLVDLAILVIDDARMRSLNLQYRGKDYTTDVLSFPQSPEPNPDGIRHLGDIVISIDQAMRQAQSIGHDAAIELRFLILHGLLHLLGYDHERDQGEMLTYQAEIKRDLAKYF